MSSEISLNTRENSLSKALDIAFEKPSVKGLLCADTNGLLIAGFLFSYSNTKFA